LLLLLLLLLLPLDVLESTIVLTEAIGTIADSNGRRVAKLC
jgi:hypothetical protein